MVTKNSFQGVDKITKTCLYDFTLSTYWQFFKPILSRKGIPITLQMQPT
jgi:hypothetical protein